MIARKSAPSPGRPASMPMPDMPPKKMPRPTMPDMPRMPKMPIRRPKGQ